MAGLLDNLNDPLIQGLLAAGFAGMAGYNRRTPMNSMGRAGLAGLMGYSNAANTQNDQKRQALLDQVTQMQLQKYQSDLQDSENTKQFYQQYGKAMTPVQIGEKPQYDYGFAGGGSMDMAGGNVKSPMIPEFGQNKDALSALQQNPLFSQMMGKNAFELATKPPEYKVVGNNLVQLGQDGAKSVFTAPEAVKPPSSVQEYQFAVNQGYRGTFDQWNKETKRAGATNVVTKIDNKMGEGLAKEVGPMMSASTAAAQGAIQQAKIAQDIDSAISSGKVIAGPGANIRLIGAQIGQLSGLGGKDNAETLSKTRETIQGLAKFTLAGRSALKGQGQISDFEGKLLMRAESGNIEDLTIPEIQVLTKVARRVADAQYKEHNRKMSVLRKNPELSGVADFYDVPPPFTQNAEPSQQQNRVRKYNPATGMIE